MYRLLIAALLPFLTSCAGLAVGSFAKSEKTLEDVVLSDHGTKNVYARPGFGTLATGGLSKKDLYDSWGEPDEINEHGKCTVISYHDGYTWAGVGAFVLFLPIPIGVPTGKAEKRFYFFGDELVSYVSESTDINSMFGYMCGSNECNFNFGATNRNKASSKLLESCGV